MFIQCSNIGRQLALQSDGARKVIGGEHVALDFTKADLALIQPARVLGQPVNADRKGQLQRGQPRPELLGGRGGPLARITWRTVTPAHRALGKNAGRKAVQSTHFVLVRVWAQVSPLATTRAQKSGRAPSRFYRSAPCLTAPGTAVWVAVTRWRAGIAVFSSAQTGSAPSACRAGAWA